MIKLFLIFSVFPLFLSAQTMDIYYSSTCDTSYKARNFIADELKRDYPNLKVVEHDIFEKKEGKKMKEIGRRFKIRRLSVPLVVVDDYEYISGYICERTTGLAYRDSLDNVLYP